MRKIPFYSAIGALAFGIAFAFAAHGAATPAGAAQTAPAKRARTTASSATLVTAIASPKLAIATFAGGCFWTMERAFDKVPGVIRAISGYSGGHVKNPTYDQVSTGATGHVETVEVRYDPTPISYAKLLDIYWHDIDPTQVGGQACDVGDEYRSMIFTHDAAQMQQAQAYKDSLKSRFAKPIAVQVVAAGPFYPAEEYHQQFTLKNPQYYEQYRIGCGRDRRLQAVWGAAAHR